MSGIARKFFVTSAVTPSDPAWNLAYATVDPVRRGEWDITTAVFLQSFSVGAQESLPAGLFFKPDGLKMYIIGTSGDDVNEYDLSTAWNVSTASFLQNFSVAAQETIPEGLFFRDDGLKMYICGSTADTVFEYDLSTAWDITTAVFLQNFSVAAQEAAPTGLFFKPDGLKMYICGVSGDDVNEYDLSTAWDVSTASFLQNFSVAAQEALPEDLFFRDDGLKMYIIGDTGNDVNEYNLSTAWDVSTASFLHNFSVLSQDNTPNALFFKPDGLKMYIVAAQNDRVNEYDLALPGRVFSVAAQEAAPTGLFFKPDGLKMYICGTSGDDVNEYDLSLAWDITTAIYLQSFSVAAEEITPAGLFFKPDGLKMYICGFAGDDVNEYDLSTAWDVSTASILQNVSVAAQETVPHDLFFRDDGLKMYIIGTNDDDVNEYDLSTAWDVSTASFLQNFSVAAQELAPQGLFFKPDGLKMYIIGTSGDDVNAYNLSTAWDVSTASFLRNFSVAAQQLAPNALFFKPDGLKMFVIGFTPTKVFEYIFTA